MFLLSLLVACGEDPAPEPAIPAPVLEDVPYVPPSPERVAELKAQQDQSLCGAALPTPPEGAESWMVGRGEINGWSHELNCDLARAKDTRLELVWRDDFKQTPSYHVACYGDVSLSIWLAGATEPGSFGPQADWHASPNVSVLFESSRGSLERSSLEAHKGVDPISLEVTITEHEASADAHRFAGCLRARWVSQGKSDHGEILAAFSARALVEEEVGAPR